MFEQLPLKDIHLPDAVSWWPPAIGWWLLPVALLLIILLLRMLTERARRRARRRRLRRRALDELARIEREFQSTGNISGTMERVSVLLRRVAITVFPGTGVAGRVGQEWVEWLRRTGPADLDAVAFDPLVDGPYRALPNAAPQRVLQAVRRWIHHVTRHPARSP